MYGAPKYKKSILKIIVFREFFKRIVRRKEFFSVLVLLLGISGALEYSTRYFPIVYMENKAKVYLSSSKEKAIETFVIVRGLNGFISVLESTRFGIPGDNVSPLETLQPVEDLIKQLSDVLLLSVVSIYIQQFLLELSQAVALRVILPLGCGFWLLSFWFQKMPGFAFRCLMIGRLMIIIAIFARFVIPVSGWAEDWVAEHFLAESRDQSIAQLAEINNSAEKDEQKDAASQSAPDAIMSHSKPAESSTAPQTYLDITKNAISNTYNGIMQKAKIFTNPASRIASIITHSANLLISAIEIFILEMIIVPLCTFFIFYIILHQIIKLYPKN